MLYYQPYRPHPQLGAFAAVQSTIAGLPEYVTQQVADAQKQRQLDQEKFLALAAQLRQNYKMPEKLSYLYALFNMALEMPATQATTFYQRWDCFFDAQGNPIRTPVNNDARNVWLDASVQMTHEQKMIILQGTGINLINVPAAQVAHAQTNLWMWGAGAAFGAFVLWSFWRR